MFTFKHPYGFKIRTKADAIEFCEELLVSGSVDIPDLDDKTLYHCLCKNHISGDVSLGSAHYGKDPITAEPVMMDKQNVPERVFHLRKHINQRLFAGNT